MHRGRLRGFETARPHLEAYLESIKGYQKNRLPRLDPALKEKVTRAWRRTFEEWGYAT